MEISNLEPCKDEISTTLTYECHIDCLLIVFRRKKQHVCDVIMRAPTATFGVEDPELPLPSQVPEIDRSTCAYRSVSHPHDLDRIRMGLSVVV